MCKANVKFRALIMEIPFMAKKMPDAKTTPLIWVREFWEIKNCSNQTVYTAIKNGALKSVKQFGTTFIVNDAKAREWQPMESKKRF